MITIAYAAEIPDVRDVHGASDAAAAEWFDLKDLPELAFDHDKIIEAGRRLIAG